MSSPGPSKPSPSHLVLNCRDLDASHTFYTEVLGFEQVGVLDGKNEMRFYRGDGDHHHDIALAQVPDPADSPDVVEWTMFPKAAGIGHIALEYGTREAWLQQLEHMQSMDVPFLVRGNHGMTHSVYVADPDGNGIECLYDLPREVWEDDVNAALNFFEPVSRKGEAALEDDTNYAVFGKS